MNCDSQSYIHVKYIRFQPDEWVLKPYYPQKLLKPSLFAQTLILLFFYSYIFYFVFFSSLISCNSLIMLFKGVITIENEFNP